MNINPQKLINWLKDNSIHYEENLTSVIVTHEMRTVFEVGTRVLFLDDGIIKYDGSPNNMKKSKDKTVLQFLSGSSSL